MAIERKLSPAQRSALVACADAGALNRTRDGYTGIGAAPFHSSRTVFALERFGLLAFVEGKGETQLQPTGRGWAEAAKIAGHAYLHVKQGQEAKAA